MTKEQLTEYILEAVDALDENDLDRLFPPSHQPDLFTLVQELTGLKGEVKKMAGTSLKLNNEVHTLLEKMEEQQAQFKVMVQDSNIAPDSMSNKVVDKELESLLGKILDMDEMMQRTGDSHNELPELTWFNQNHFKIRLASWQKGYDMVLKQWLTLIKSSGLYKTGLPGEQFDPKIHEAIAVKHETNKRNNVILETEQTGYLFKNKLIRPAKVVVNRLVTGA